MGGHTQFGEYLTLREVTDAWRGCLYRYEQELGLFLRYAQISYDSKELKYKLFMRFAK